AFQRELGCVISCSAEPGNADSLVLKVLRLTYRRKRHERHRQLVCKGSEDCAVSSVESSKNGWRPHHHSKFCIASQQHRHRQGSATDVNNAAAQTIFFEKS